MKLDIDEALVALIQDAAEKAFRQLFDTYDENFYYCSLITTGEGLCPVISAWSEEALERMTSQAENVEEERYYLKWSYGESPYFTYGEEYFSEVNRVFSERMRQIKTDEAWTQELQLRINSMEQAMSNLDKAGLFGQGEQRLKLVINAEFMPPDATNTERAIRLNPKTALEEWLEEAAE